jgi:hypothetical protein
VHAFLGHQDVPTTCAAIEERAAVFALFAECDRYSGSYGSM